MSFRISKSTFAMSNPPTIKAFSSTVSSKEGEGPLGSCFDVVENDTHFGQETWEQAESELQKQTVKRAIKKAGITPEDVNFIFAGDLINQCIGSAYGIRELNIPFLGLYGACSTMAEGLLLATLLADNGVGDNIVATTSYISTAERQFRFPLSYGSQRTHSPMDLFRLRCRCGFPIVSSTFCAVTIGKVVDLGVTDMNNMGAAMAPAADTIKTHLNDMGKSQPTMTTL